MTAMEYVSTRALAPPARFVDILLAGLAPDGGLYVPKEIAPLPAAVIKAAATVPYAQTAAAVLAHFAGDDLGQEACVSIAEEAYGGQWANPAITPLTQLGAGTYLLELFHGPSLAFKDVAMQMLAGLYRHVLAQTGRKVTVICATSGDTGGAAVEALANVEGVSLFVLMPEGRVSDVQRRFMTGSGAENVHALSIKGDFDEAQALVKTLFADQAFCAEVSLTPVNSINWARILAQSVYFIVASSILSGAGPVNFVVPSGNFGDALAGLLAKKLGAPIGEIKAATNVNDGIVKALESGEYKRSAHSTATISPAMDITVASNFERAIYWALGDDGQATKTLYDGFAQSGSFTIPPKGLEALQKILSGESIDDSETRFGMADCLDQTGALLCPHSAIGWRARWGQEEMAGPQVILATAHAAKFPETCEAVTGKTPALPPHVADLYERTEHLSPIEADPAALKTLLRATFEGQQ